MVTIWWLWWGYNEENQRYLGFEWNGSGKIMGHRPAMSHGFYHPTMGSILIPGFVRVSPWAQVRKKYWTQSPFLKPRCSWCLVPLHWPSSRRKWSLLLPIPDSQHTLRSSDCRFLGWRTISNHANGSSSRIASFRIFRHFETASKEIPHIKMRST